MKRKWIIGVIGHHKNAEEIHLKIAEEVGKEISKRNSIILCGGVDNGVPDAVAKGAKDNDEHGGICVGILPGSDNSSVSKYLDIPILTGIGYARNQIIGLTADALIVIGGGVGTLTEMCYAYNKSKPIVVIKGLDGLGEQFIGKYMDKKKTVKIIGANSAKEAVDIVFKLLNQSQLE